MTRRPTEARVEPITAKMASCDGAVSQSRMSAMPRWQLPVMVSSTFRRSLRKVTTVVLEAASGHDSEQPDTTEYCRRSTWNWEDERERERLCCRVGSHVRTSSLGGTQDLVLGDGRFSLRRKRAQSTRFCVSVCPNRPARRESTRRFLRSDFGWGTTRPRRSALEVP